MKRNQHLVLMVVIPFSCLVITPFGRALEFYGGIGTVAVQAAMTEQLTVDQGQMEM